MYNVGPYRTSSIPASFSYNTTLHLLLVLWKMETKTTMEGAVFYFLLLKFPFERFWKVRYNYLVSGINNPSGISTEVVVNLVWPYV